MMKRLLFVCAFIFAAAATFAVDIGTALDQAAEQFSSTLQTGTTVAIVGIASDTDDMSEYMLDELTLRFVQQRRLTVANRANLDAIKQEMNFQLSGEVSDASMQEIGAMAGAETVIHGSLRKLGSAYILSLQALNVTTATVEDMYRATIEPNETTNLLLLEGKENKIILSESSKLNDGTKKITVGLRGVLSMNAGTSTSEELPREYQNKLLVGGGAALFGKYNFTPTFGLQAELSIIGNNGLKYEIDFYDDMYGYVTGSMTYSYTSLDIPVLLSFDVISRERFCFTLFAGPYISFPTSKLKVSVEEGSVSGTDQGDIDSAVIFGLTGGVSSAFSLGKGAIIADIRYNLDFIPINVENTNLFTRRFLAISAGYQLKF